MNSIHRVRWSLAVSCRPPLDQIQPKYKLHNMVECQASEAWKDDYRSGERGQTAPPVASEHTGLSRNENPRCSAHLRHHNLTQSLWPLKNTQYRNQEVCLQRPPAR